MPLKIAIQPDEVVHRSGERQSFSARWIERAKTADVEVVRVDVTTRDPVSQIAGCDAFMWRCDPTAYPRQYARRLLYAIEHGMGIPTFPSLKSWWHFEDKISQAYFLAAAGIPIPATDIAWTRPAAEQYCESATYPFVIKLSAGFQGTNVRLVRNRDDAHYYVDQLFGPGVVSLGYQPASGFRQRLRRLRIAIETLQGRHPNRPTAAVDLEYGYLLAQEFLPGNDFDVRVTVIGNRAFVFRRFNRPDDFRASGSGRIDWNPTAIDEDAVRLAYRVAGELQAQTVGIDILRRGAQPVVGELTLTYASWAVRDCPGHWLLHGAHDTGKLEWVEGSTEPADAIFTDFVAQLRRPHVAKAANVA